MSLLAPVASGWNGRENIVRERTKRQPPGR